MFVGGLSEHAAGMAEGAGSELPMSHLTFSLAPQPCGRLGLPPLSTAISSPFACLSGVCPASCALPQMLESDVSDCGRRPVMQVGLCRACWVKQRPWWSLMSATSTSFIQCL